MPGKSSGSSEKSVPSPGVENEAKQTVGVATATNSGDCEKLVNTKTSLPAVPKKSVQRKHKNNQITESISSKERKRSHESSKNVLPPQNPFKKDTFYALTSYSVDFNKKDGKPARIRPCSVTRRNRPHPLMDFLIPQNIRHMVNKQRFYDDYVGRFKLDCGFKQRDSASSPIPPAMDTSQHLNNKVVSKINRSFSPITEPQYNMKRASKEFETWMNASKNPGEKRLPNIIVTQERRSESPLKANVPLCITKEAAGNFSKWVKKSTARDRRIVAELMDAGDRGYLEEFLDATVHPSAIGAMQEWLRKCEDEERSVALDFLKSVRKLPKVPGSHSQHKETCLCKTCDFRQAEEIYAKTKIRSVKGKPFGIAGKRTLLEKRPLRNRPGFSYREPRKLTRPKGFQPKFTDYSHIVTNKGAMFMQPHKKRGGHFEIHPEFSTSFMI